MSFRGQASSAKMTSFWGKLTALVCHQTKRVNKAEELTYLSLNIEIMCYGVLTGYPLSLVINPKLSMTSLKGKLYYKGVIFTAHTNQNFNAYCLHKELLTYLSIAIGVLLLILSKEGENDASRGQCYKTFFVRNLRIFILS